MKLLIVLTMAAVLVSACGSGRRAEPLIGPITLDESAGKGRTVYEQHCFRCHSQGEGGLAPSLNDKPLPRFLMRTQIRAGLGAMPSFSRQHISDEEMESLLDYLLALRRAGN